MADLPQLTPEQLQDILSKGGSIDGASAPASNVTSQPQGMSATQAALATLKAHGGGTVGGGIGALAAPWLLGPEAGIPADILLGIAGSLAGGYAGQKGQQAIQSDATNQQQQQEATQAETEHPIVSGATDIASGALASGGSFSPGTTLKALKHLMGGEVEGGADALKNVLLQGTINPAINTGVDLATSGQLPSGSNLLEQSIGGALFAKPSWLGQLASKGGVGQSTIQPEPKQEPTTEGMVASNTEVPKEEVKAPIATDPEKPVTEAGETKEDLQKQLEDATGQEEPEVQKPKFIGTQEFPGTDRSKDIHMYNLAQPIVDSEGKVLHDTGSTVSAKTLDKYGVDYDKPGVAPAKDVEPQQKLLSQIQLGVNRPAPSYQHLSSLNDEAFKSEHKSASEALDAMEGKVDDGTLNTQDLNQRTELAQAQDRYTAAELEQFRRDHIGDVPADLMHELKQVAGKAINFGPKSEQYQQAKILINELQRQNASSQEALGEATLKSHDDAEIFKGQMGDIQKVVEMIKQESEKSNAIQEQSTAGLLQQQQSKTGETGSERGEVEPSVKRNEVTEPHTEGQEGSIPVTAEREELKANPVGGLANVTKSVVDKLAEVPSTGAKALAKGLKLTLNEQHQLVGRFKNPVVEAGNKLSTSDKAQVNKIIDAELSTGKPYPEMLTTAAQKEFYNQARKQLDESGKFAIENKIPISQSGVPRLMRQNPTYWPGMANQRVEEMFRKNTDVTGMRNAEKVFDEWNQKSLGMSPDESAKRVDDWKNAIQGSTSNPNISHQDYFNALRKSAGSPLPPEFREQNPVRALSRYFDRFSIAAAHYKNVESNHEIMSALGQQKDAWGKDIAPSKEGVIANNPIVRTALQTFKSEASNVAEHNEAAMSSLATNAFIAGPALEAHKVISNQVKALAFAPSPYQAVRSLGHALTNIKGGYIHAKENGLVTLSASSVKDMFDGSLTSAERMMGASKLIRNVSTLGGLTTKMNAAMLQGQMEYLIPSKLHRAQQGSKTDQLFLRNLDPNYKVDKAYSPVEIQKLASIAASYVHGTGDIRSMPAWMMNDGEVSGFMSLAHWSVAQTNNFVKDVWEPASRGDVAPLLASVFGSVAGGYLIKQLREEISGKKSPIPSLSEIVASDKGLSGNKPLLMYNAIAAMQYSGFGGLLSQVAKYPFDFVYKNAPQGATFPLDEVGTDLASTLKNVSSAIANDPNINYVDLAKAVMMHTLSSNIQLSRIAINQGINNGLISGLPAEKKILADKMGELRRFDMAEGLPYNDIDEGTNPYMNIEQKKFKMEQDLPTAMKELPGLMQNIIANYHNQPDVMLSKLKALKQNDYATMPSLEDMPLSFVKYLGYLNREQGPVEAQKALHDYLLHKVTNEAKASVVP